MRWYKRNPDAALAETLKPGQSTYGGGQWPPKEHVPHFVYVIGAENGPAKIGITTNLGNRIRSIQTGCPFKIDLFWSALVASREIAREMEEDIFSVLPRKNGEWLDVPPSTVIHVLMDGA